MSRIPAEIIAEYEVDFEAIENASPIKMGASYTVVDCVTFTNVVSELREVDKARVKETGGRSRFNNHQPFLEHVLSFLMNPRRKKYFSIRTRNQKGSKYSYRNISYIVELLLYCQWIRRVPDGIVNLSVGTDVPQPKSRIEVLEALPIIEGDYQILNLDRDVGYVKTERVTWNDGKGAYLEGSYTEANQAEDNELLRNYNQLMLETDIRDKEGNQFHWLNPLERRIKFKDYPYRNGRLQGTAGGRFWGPRFQQKGEGFRLSHTFNGESLVEVDIRRCYTQFAFHMNDIPIPDLRNFYDIPDEISNDPDVNKKKIKSIFNRVYFVSGERNWKASLYKSHRIKPDQADLLLPRYDPIRNLIFNKSLGHQLMWMESQLVRQVLMNAVEDSVPVIPIHDSYLVPIAREGWVKSCINSAYHHFREPFVGRRELVGDEEWFHYQVQTTSDYPKEQ